ncbi:5-deoxy-glucuronate isomerase [Streptomyces sp. NPDC058735]|uniref:5-deoxy-glucuronate isomerase n=1 Tax=unclassified Streptomyces TaxID=2593676 RepID=UPI0036B8D5F3
MTGEPCAPQDTVRETWHVRGGRTVRGEDLVRTEDTVRTADQESPLPGGRSVFAPVTGLAYAPRGTRAQIASGAGGRFALAGAKCGRQLPARYGPAPEVPAEERGGAAPNGSGRQRVFPSCEGGTAPCAEGRIHSRPDHAESTEGYR